MTRSRNRISSDRRGTRSAAPSCPIPSRSRITPIALLPSSIRIGRVWAAANARFHHPRVIPAKAHCCPGFRGKDANSIIFSFALSRLRVNLLALGRPPNLHGSREDAKARRRRWVKEPIAKGKRSSASPRLRVNRSTGSTAQAGMIHAETQRRGEEGCGKPGSCLDTSVTGSSLWTVRLTPTFAKTIPDSNGLSPE